jgi:type IV secretion system protein VirB3
MKLGIPLVPLVVLIGVTGLVVLWGGLLVSGWIAVVALGLALPALVWMRWITRLDDQRFRQMALLLRLQLADHNRRLWRARSYSPTLYRGVRDAWSA